MIVAQLVSSGFDLLMTDGTGPSSWYVKECSHRAAPQNQKNNAELMKTGNDF